MVYDDIKVSRETRRLPDDQVTLGSFDYGAGTDLSDDWTLSGDDDIDNDANSFSDASSVSSYDSIIRDTPLPSYRVPKEQGVSGTVYEAWTVYCAPDNKEVVTGTKICGVNVFQHYDQLYGHVNTRPTVHTQAELMDMHLAALDRYQTANKRSLPSRLVRGRAKPYEQDLDERTRKLPMPVQNEINTLLADREHATSNRYHLRDWHLVLMTEQYRYRFSSPAPEDVKRHKLRFWKNKNKNQPVEYLVVLCGKEITSHVGDKGHYIQRRFGNPWSKVDKYEHHARERARAAKAYETEKLRGRRARSPSRRRPSPPPVYRHARPRSISPPTPPPFARATPCAPSVFPSRPYMYSTAPPPPPPPLTRYPSYPPPHPPAPMPYQVPPPSFGPVYSFGSSPPPPHPPAGIPARPYPYAQNLSYPPPVGAWNSPPQPAAAPMPFVSVCSSRPSYPSYPSCGPSYGPMSMHVPPPPRPDFPPPPARAMPLTPPSFPAPPPPPMPSNLTTPTFTATASERSVPQRSAACIHRPPPPPGCFVPSSWMMPCAACKASQNVARSDADVSELAVEVEEVGEKEVERKKVKVEKGTDSGLGDEEEDDDEGDDAQSLYD